MSQWWRIPLTRLPQVWPADAELLEKAGIDTAEGLVRAVGNEGLRNLSDETGIPTPTLDDYATAAEGMVASRKTRRWAAGISTLVLLVMLSLSLLIFLIQADLLSRPDPNSPEAQYAELKRKYEGALNQQALLEEVTAKLEGFKNQAIKPSKASLVNLQLLSAAVQDSIALEKLQAAVDDPTSADRDSAYRDYTAAFNKAREQQQEVPAGDPRNVFARVNAAEAWAKRSEVLGAIDPELYAVDIRNSDAQARNQISLARNVPGVSSAFLDERIDQVLVDLDGRGTSALRAQAERIQRQVDQVKQDLGDVQTDVSDLRGAFDTLQSTLSQILTQLASQEGSIIGSVTNQHIETRTQIDALASALDSRLDSELDTVNKALVDANNSLDGLSAQLNEHVGFVVFETSAPSRDCGLVDLESARALLKEQCMPRGGIADPVRFDVTITKASEDGEPSIIATGPQSSDLMCNIEDTLSQFDFQPGLHRCQLVFRSN